MLGNWQSYIYIYIYIYIYVYDYICIYVYVYVCIWSVPCMYDIHHLTTWLVEVKHEVKWHVFQTPHTVWSVYTPSNHMASDIRYSERPPMNYHT